MAPRSKEELDALAVIDPEIDAVSSVLLLDEADITLFSLAPFPCPLLFPSLPVPISSHRTFTFTNADEQD